MFCCLGSPGIFAGDPASASEKIQFSDPGDDFKLPVNDPNSKLLPKPFEFLDRGSSVSGVIAPDLGPGARALPNAPPNARLLELFERRLDQKKNWVYVRPDDAKTQPTLEEMFGVRGSAAYPQDQHTRSVLAGFIEDFGRGPSTSRRSESSMDAPDKTLSLKSFDQNFSVGNRIESSGDARFEDALGTRGPARMEFSVPNGFLSPQPDPVRSGDSLDRFLGGPRVRDRDRPSHSDDFRKLLVTQSGINPLAAGFDPINLKVDGTRQELNPVTPPGLDTGLVGQGALSEAVSGQSSIAGRASMLFGTSATALGSSSLAPVVSTSLTPRAQPQPVVLEFPKRRF